MLCFEAIFTDSAIKLCFNVKKHATSVSKVVDGVKVSKLFLRFHIYPLAKKKKIGQFMCLFSSI